MGEQGSEKILTTRSAAICRAPLADGEVCPNLPEILLMWEPAAVMYDGELVPDAATDDTFGGSLLVCQRHAKDKIEEIHQMDQHSLIYSASNVEIIERVLEHTIVIPERIERIPLYFKDDESEAVTLPKEPAKPAFEKCEECGGTKATVEGEVGKHKGQCLIGEREMNIQKNPAARWGRFKNGMPKPKPKAKDFTKGVDTSEIRQWLVDHGHNPGTHGRISQEMRQIYIDAHMADTTADKVDDAINK